MKKMVIILTIAGILAVGTGAFLTKGKKAANEALKWEGMEELGNNEAFKNKEFQKKMQEAGFKKGYEWCVIFAKMVWLNVFKQDVEIIKKIISPSSMQTWKNFSNTANLQGKFVRVEAQSKPKPGDIVVWQRKGSAAKGHAGLVTKVNNDLSFKTIEGNSNEDGSANGYGVFIKENKPLSSNRKSFILLGFLRKL